MLNSFIFEGGAAVAFSLGVLASLLGMTINAKRGR